MSANQFGNLFCLTTFGESHGPAMGALIDGCPAGVEFDQQLLLTQLARRRPGQSAVVSSRQEEDLPEILSGVFQGKTLGTPILIVVKNKDQRSEDYQSLKDRIGHADDVWREKFAHVDPRGGGRSSGRETLSRVLGGAVAEMFLKSLHPDLKIVVAVEQIGKNKSTIPQDLTRERVDQSLVRMPDLQVSDQVIKILEQAKIDGESYGGVALLRITGMPKSLGQPVFHKLKSDLASALMGVGATCGVEFGSADVSLKGTEFHKQNLYGGVRGGISTGELLEVRVKFKPTSSILDVAKKGRHDPCIVPRACSVIEGMAALVLADHVLWQRLDQLTIPR